MLKKEKYSLLKTKNGFYVKDNVKMLLFDGEEVVKLLNYYHEYLLTNRKNKR